MSSDTRRQSKGIRDPCCRRQCQVLGKGTMGKPMEYRFRKLGEHRAVKLREEQALFLGSTCRKKGVKWWQGSGKGEHGKTGRVRSNHGKCFSIQKQMCGYYVSLPHPFLCSPQPLSLMGDHGSLVDMCVSFFLPVILLLKGLQRALCFCRASSWYPQTSPHSAHGGLKLCKVSLCLFC